MNSSITTNRSEEHSGLRASMPAALYDSLYTLVQRIYGARNGARPRTIMLTAAKPASGVSYISSCLSTLLADVLGTSLLMDGHAALTLARRRFAPMRSDCTSVDEGRLSVLGRAEAKEISEGSPKGRMNAQLVMDSLINEFDYIVVDAPALSASKVAHILSPHVDGVLLVVVPNETDIFDISVARKTLSSRGARILGAVYNMILDHHDTTTGHLPCSD